MDTAGVIQLIILVMLLVLSAFFSSAETAFTSANKLHIRTLVEAGDKRAARAQAILDMPGKMLSSILIGNNIVNLVASSLVTTLVIRIFGNRLVGVFTGVLTFVIILFGEVIPKSWATIHADRIAMSYAAPVRILMIALTPVIWVVDHLSQGIIRLLHLGGKPGEGAMTEDDLRTIVDVGHEEGVIESGEKEIIHNVFDFSDSVAADVMIPRAWIEALPIDATYDEAARSFTDTMYTRIPVYDGDTVNIVGYLHIKDFYHLSESQRQNFDMGQVMRQVAYTYERKKTLDLFMEMRSGSDSIVIVVDEYGSGVGMITMEDLLEELVGEISDEYDEEGGVQVARDSSKRRTAAVLESLESTKRE